MTVPSALGQRILNGSLYDCIVAVAFGNADSLGNDIFD